MLEQTGSAELTEWFAFLRLEDEANTLPEER